MSKKTVHFIFLGLAVFILLAFLALLGLPMLFSSALEGKKSHDFGVVQIERPHTIFEHVFTLKNATDHTLQLVDTVATCGCTTTDWPDEPVLSGEVIRIPVHLKLQRSEHKASKIRLIFDICISSNDVIPLLFTLLYEILISSYYYSNLIRVVVVI